MAVLGHHTSALDVFVTSMICRHKQRTGGGGGVGWVSFTRLLVSFGFVVAAVLFVRTKRHCAIHLNLLRAMIWRDTAYFKLQFFTSIPFTRSGKLGKLNSGKLHENLLLIIKFKILFNCVNDEFSWSVSLGSPWKSIKLYYWGSKNNVINSMFFLE